MKLSAVALVFLAATVPAVASISNVRIGGTTATEAILAYTAPSSSACILVVSDGNYYSRALQANTLHYCQIACGSDTASGTFATASLP